MANNPEHTWEVIGQQPDVGPNDQGVFVQGMTVTYRTKSGAVGKVFVPQANFTVDYVRQVVDQAACVPRVIHGMALASSTVPQNAALTAWTANRTAPATVSGWVAIRPVGVELPWSVG